VTLIQLFNTRFIYLFPFLCFLNHRCNGWVKLSNSFATAFAAIATAATVTTRGGCTVFFRRRRLGGSRVNAFESRVGVTLPNVPAMQLLHVLKENEKKKNKK
jgi:hypothetical protein